MTFQYKVEALDFVVKDDFTQIRNRICECMANAIEKYKNVTRGLLFIHTARQLKLHKQTIKYVVNLKQLFAKLQMLSVYSIT